MCEPIMDNVYVETGFTTRLHIQVSGRYSLKVATAKRAACLLWHDRCDTIDVDTV